MAYKEAFKTAFKKGKESYKKAKVAAHREISTSASPLGRPQLQMRIQKQFGGGSDVRKVKRKVKKQVRRTKRRHTKKK